MTENLDRSTPSPSASAGAEVKPSKAIYGAALLALTSMSSVQFGAAVSASVMDEYGVFHTTWLRLCWAAVVLTLAVRPNFSRLDWPRLKAVLLLGLAMSGMTVSFFVAINRIPMGLVVAIQFMGPLAIATFGARSIRALIWPPLAFAGVLLLARNGQGGIGDPEGLLFAGGSAFGWASYIIMMKKTGALFAGLDGLALSLIVAALVATPFAFIDHDGGITLQQLVVTGGLALLLPLLPYALEMIALRRLPAASFGILMSLEPAIGALAGFLVLAQPLTLVQCLGTALVVAASIGSLKSAT